MTFWGRGIVEPDRAHIRETRAGQPMGFAICGCLLIADVTEEDVASGAYRQCSRCLELQAAREPGVDYPLWTLG